jgi:hypothetical protein
VSRHLFFQYPATAAPARRVGIALAVASSESHRYWNMNQKFSSLRPVLAFLAGAALLTGCDKGEPTAAPATAPSVAPPPVAVDTVSPAPAAEPLPPAPALTGEAALAAFKEEVKGIKAFMEANQGNTDPAVALANLRELIKRAAAVSTAGLPEDLGSAYQTMIGVMQGVQATLDDLPVPAEQLQQYTADEKAKGGAAAEEIMAKRAAFEAAMAAHQKDGEAATAKLKEVSAKYGIESLDLGGN